MQSAPQAGLIISAWDAFVLLMGDFSFSGLIIADMLLTLVFSALGAGLEIYAISRQIKRKNTIK